MKAYKVSYLKAWVSVIIFSKTKTSLCFLDVSADKTSAMEMQFNNALASSLLVTIILKLSDALVDVDKNWQISHLYPSFTFMIIFLSNNLLKEQSLWLQGEAVRTFSHALPSAVSLLGCFHSMC